MIGELEFDFSVTFGFTSDGISLKLLELAWAVERTSLKGSRTYIHTLVYAMLSV